MPSAQRRRPADDPARRHGPLPIRRAAERILTTCTSCLHQNVTFGAKTVSQSQDFEEEGTAMRVTQIITGAVAAPHTTLTRVYALPVVREVPRPPADPGTTGTW